MGRDIGTMRKLHAVIMTEVIVVSSCAFRRIFSLGVRDLGSSLGSAALYLCILPINFRGVIQVLCLTQEGLFACFYDFVD